MSEYLIRLYKDSDYVAARELFAHGTEEHSTKFYHHLLGLKRIWLLLVAVSSLMLHFVSVTMSILAAAIALVCTWFGAQFMYTSYVKFALSDDMLDIWKYYLQREGCCFWVAELAGEVVGTVAVLPSSYPGGEKYLELKRLSVSKRHRGKGIAKRLCRTLIDFARNRGCEAVVLNTTFVQYEAWTLYEKMGFRQTHTYYPPEILGKLLDFKILAYQYDIPPL
ncbi:probable N-acetyltransferase 8B isoform X3 [Pseudophryne corroboree]|uniref:probable N-acetyltransferase 8B isoform X3 n=1 Tax=Pseudophryne corroboree TaxID=495146 RepID=UPI003081F6D4